MVSRSVTFREDTSRDPDPKMDELQGSERGQTPPADRPRAAGMQLRAETGTDCLILQIQVSSSLSEVWILTLLPFLKG